MLTLFEIFCDIFFNSLIINILLKFKISFLFGNNLSLNNNSYKIQHKDNILDLVFVLFSNICGAK